MVVFPWLLLAAIVILASFGALAAISRLRARRDSTEAPFAIGLAAGVMVAVPLLLLILAWGIFLKPR